MDAVPPDLSDPAARAAYLRELRGVARPIRLLGVALALLGLAVATARIWLPQIPGAVPIFLIVMAAVHMLAGIVIRMKYHQARMKGNRLHDNRSP